ncbi:MAG: hypothetical protein AB7I34_10500 [Rhizobiaceae bacterium]
MLKILLRVALAYAAYRISREFVQSVPDIESGPDPAGMYQPARRQTARKRSPGGAKRQAGKGSGRSA